jgi:lysophospholipase L1-like esterase
MKYFWWALVLIIVAYAGYEYVRMSALIKISAGLVAEAKPYESATGTRSILVLGDSTAVGVGSPSDEAVAGRLGEYLNATVENYAKSGAVTADLAGQLSQAKQTHYDVILIQIGANDVIRFRSLAAAQSELDADLKVASKLSDHVVVLTAGKIGEAPFFPRLLGFIWTWRVDALRTRFIATTAQNGALYVDLYSIPDPFTSDPARYYAPDGLHLTGDGYGFWFEQVQKAIASRWPVL